MKKLFVLLLLLTTTTLFAQEKMNSEMKAWMDFAIPNWGHEVLQKHVGDWKIETKMWHEPGKDPEVSVGTAKAESILGGRYIQTKYKGTSMGMPMEGFAIDAYDKVKETFISVWIDNFGTGVATSYGKISEDKKSIIYKGSMTDPVSQGDLKFKSVLTFLNNDEYTFEMFMIMGDKEIKSMEMRNTRVK